MDDCIMFCEVWRAREYILIGGTIIACFLASAWAAYDGSDIDEIVAVGVTGAIATFVFLLVVLNIQILLVLSALFALIGGGAWLGWHLRDHGNG